MRVWRGSMSGFLVACFWCIFFICKSAHCDVACDKTPSTKDRLMKELFRNYDSYRRPVNDSKATVKVSLRMMLISLELDDATDTITVHNRALMTWTDDNLGWERTAYDNKTTLRLSSTRIWTPDLSLHNADASSGQSSYFFTMCSVSFKGRVWCWPHVWYTALCAPDVSRWPYDTQNCTLRFGGWMYTSKQINFTLLSFANLTHTYNTNQQWSLLAHTVDQSLDKLPCCPDDLYPTLRYHYVLQRRSATHAAMVVTPAIILIVMTVATLLLGLPRDDRLYLAAINLFSHHLFVEQLSWYVPSNGEKAAIVVLFFRDSTLIAVLVLLETLALRGVYRFKSEPWRLVSGVNSLFKSGPAQSLMFHQFDQDDDAAAAALACEDGGTPTKADDDMDPARAWCHFAAAFNNICLVATLFAYVVLFISYLT